MKYSTQSDATPRWVGKEWLIRRKKRKTQNREGKGGRKENAMKEKKTAHDDVEKKKKNKKKKKRKASVQLQCLTPPPNPTISSKPFFKQSLKDPNYPS